MTIEAAPKQLRAERFPDLGDEVMYPRLSAAKIERLAEFGARRSFAAGDTLYAQGQRDAPFLIITSGRVRVLDRKPGKDVWVAEADAGTFLGDIATFTGEPAIAECVAGEPTEVVAFDRAELRAMLASWPELAELVLRTMMARRAWHEAEGHGVLRLIAPRGSRRAFEVRDLLERNLMPVRWYDVDTDDESAAMLDWLRIPREETPILVRNTSVLRNPSAAQVARELGLRAEIDGERFDLVVLGGGPAGPKQFLRNANRSWDLAPTFAPALTSGPPSYDGANGAACAQWPLHSPPSDYTGDFRAQGADPILVVGNTRDPSTPYSGAVTLTDTLDNASLLTLVGDGHTSYSRSQCIRDRVDAYLIDRTLPEPGVDDRCVEDPLQAIAARRSPARTRAFVFALPWRVPPVATH